MRLLALSMLLLASTGAVVISADDKAVPSPRMAVIALGDVPESLVKHAAEWAQQNLAVHVDVLAAQPFVGKTLDDAAAAAIKAASSNHVHTVAVVMPPEGVNNHGMRTSDGRAAVVNLRPMAADQPAELVLEKRIERQVIRGLTLMLDMETCVNPQCVLVKYGPLQELDASGRNLCPPCLMRFQTKAHAAHLDLDEKSPYFINN